MANAVDLLLLSSLTCRSIACYFECLSLCSLKNMHQPLEFKFLFFIIRSEVFSFITYNGKTNNLKRFRVQRSQNTRTRKRNYYLFKLNTTIKMLCIFRPFWKHISIHRPPSTSHKQKTASTGLTNYELYVKHLIEELIQAKNLLCESWVTKSFLMHLTGPHGKLIFKPTVFLPSC